MSVDDDEIEDSIEDKIYIKIKQNWYWFSPLTYNLNLI